MKTPVKNMNGIITVLNTPFTKNDEIDTPSLTRNVQYAQKSGVVGFLVPAMASEVSKLRERERTLIVSTVLETINHDIPVIGGASAITQLERKNIAKQLIDQGCEGILVNIPYTEENRFIKEIEEILALDPEFLMIQDWSFTGYGIPVPTIVKIFEEHDAFKAIKVEVVPAGVKYSQILQATEGRLHVSGGWAVMQMIEALNRGVNAFMPTGMHEIYVSIYNRFKQGQIAQAQNLFNQLLPVLAFSNQHLDISVHFFKKLLFAQGIYATDMVRTPILDFDPIHEQISSTHIERVQKIISSLESGKI